MLGLVLDILKIHTSRFWISLPVRIALFSILAFFEFPSLYIEIVGLMGKNSVPATVELGAKSYGVLGMNFWGELSQTRPKIRKFGRILINFSSKKSIWFFKKRVRPNRQF